MENKDSNQSSQLEKYIAWIILIIVLIGVFLVLKPFLSAVVLAAVLTFSLWPVNRRLTKWLRGRRVLASIITTLTVSLLLVAPFVILGFNLAGDIQAFSVAMKKWAAKGPHQAPPWLEKIPLVGSQATQYWQDIADEGSRFVRKLSLAAEESPAEPPEAAPPQSQAHVAGPEESKVIGALGKVVSEVRSLLLSAVIVMGQGIIQAVISILLTFFFLCDASLGDRFTRAVVRIAGRRGTNLLNVAGNTIRGVIYGILGTAIVQGVVAGIGFAIAGVPGPVFLGLLTFFFSPLPVGPPLIWIPASIWLFAHGWPAWGVFMLVWGLGVSSIDNIIKPWLISQGSHMPFLLIFIGVIGGALAFGFIGIFIGPSLLAITYCLVDEWFGEQPKT